MPARARANSSTNNGKQRYVPEPVFPDATAPDDPATRRAPGRATLRDRAPPPSTPRSARRSDPAGRSPGPARHFSPGPFICRASLPGTQPSARRRWAGAAASLRNPHRRSRTRRVISGRPRAPRPVHPAHPRGGRHPDGLKRSRTGAGRRARVAGRRGRCALEAGAAVTASAQSLGAARDRRPLLVTRPQRHRRGFPRRRRALRGRSGARQQPTRPPPRRSCRPSAGAGPAMGTRGVTRSRGGPHGSFGRPCRWPGPPRHHPVQAVSARVGPAMRCFRRRAGCRLPRGR